MQSRAIQRSSLYTLVTAIGRDEKISTIISLLGLYNSNRLSNHNNLLHVDRIA